MKPFVLPRILSAGLAFAALVGLAVVVSTGSFTWAMQVSTPGTSGGFALGVTADVLSMVLLAFVATVAWLVTSYSSRNLAGQLGVNRFAGWLTVATLGLAVMVLGASLPVIALGWSLSASAVAGLVGHAQAESAGRAARYVRRWLSWSDIVLWAGVVAGLLLLPSVDRSGEFTSGAATVGVAALLLVAATIRSALFPVSRWLPETAEAPSPLSGFLHAGVVNGAGLLVLLMWPLFAAAPPVLAALLVIGVASVAVGTWRGRVRADVKGQLASSTTSQMGYMAIQLGIGLPAAALLHLMGHGYYKAWLFLRAGGAVTRARWRGEAEAPRFQARTVACVAGFVALAAVLAAPAVAGSVTKLGVAALLPAVLAASAVGLAVATAAGQSGRTAGSTGPGLVVGGISTVLAATYLWLLWGWEALFAAELPLVPVWSPVLATMWLLAVVAVGVGVAVVATGLSRGEYRRLWVRLARTTLPPAIQSQLRRAGRRRAVAPAPVPESLGGQPSDEEILAARGLVDVSGSLVGPVWPLRDFVAVNHLAGTTGLEFTDIDAISREVYGTSLYQSPSGYLRLFDEGVIRAASVEAVLGLRTASGGLATGGSASSAFAGLLDATRALAAAEVGQTPATAPTRSPIRSKAAAAGRPRSEQMPAVLTGLWCRAAWAKTHEGTGPWSELHTVAQDESNDAALDALLGCRGGAAWLRSLPADPLAALAVQTAASREESAGTPPEAALDLGVEAVQALPGWSGHAQWRVRQGNPTALASVIATYATMRRLHAAEFPSAPARPRQLIPATSAEAGEWPAMAELWQRALEFGYRDRLINEIRGAQGPAELPEVVRASMVFCIDVRSERMRRAMERTGPYRTYGYAGFFGAALQYQSPDGASFDQCPALISPTRSVQPGIGAQAVGASWRDRVVAAERAVSSAPVLPFLVAEFGGLFAGLANLMQNAAGPRWRHLGSQWGTVSDRWGPRELALPESGQRSSEGTATSGDAVPRADLPPSYRVTDLVAMARDFLRLAGVREPYGDLLVIVGHGATVENNAFAAGYDCGACGGNSGHINARVLAAALNHEQVRAALAAEGWHLPNSCSAVAAVHDTTTDTIEFDPYASVNPGALAALANDVDKARDAVLAERMELLPDVKAGNRSPRSVRAAVAARATDWAQPVPEWGLAGNAAFVVGPRHLTEHLDLAGRVFLHSYDADIDDADASGLRTILTAPVVVAHWINSQYYLSTVAPETFGAGDKTTHNVVGDVGVTSGAHGDLRIGLPWQSVRSVDPAGAADDPSGPAPSGASAAGGHQPLRLLVVVAAQPAQVSGIVAANADLTSLLASGWITIVVCPPDTDEALELRPDLRWVSWHQNRSGTPTHLADLAHWPS